MRWWTPALALVAFSALTCRKEESRESPESNATGLWYIRTKLSPQETSVVGIPITDHDSTWAAAIVLTPGVLPRQATEEPATRPTANFGYGLGGDFNHDGQPDSVVVGVYRSRTGSKGRFALIVTRAGSQWKKAFSAGMTGPTDVTFLIRGPGDTVLWNDCVECDAAAVKIYWDGRSYVAKWPDD